MLPWELTSGPWAMNSEPQQAARVGADGLMQWSCGMLNESTDSRALALTKLDVLGGLDELKICVAYELDGDRDY